MALEDDILQATQTVVDAGKELTAMVATIQTADPLLIVQEGASTPLPAVSIASGEVVAGRKCVAQKFAQQWVVMGLLGTYVAPDIPDVPPTTSWTRALDSDQTCPTSSTALPDLAITAVDIGTYLIEGDVLFSGTASNRFFTLTFSGTAAVNDYKINRLAGSAVVNTFGQVLGTETASTGTTMPQQNRIAGVMVVTAAGDFGVSVRAATAGTVTKGAWVRLTKVA